MTVELERIQDTSNEALISQTPTLRLCRVGLVLTWRRSRVILQWQWATPSIPINRSRGGILHCRLTFCLLLCLVCKMRASPTREDAVFFVFQLVAVSACSWDTFFFFLQKKRINLTNKKKKNAQRYRLIHSCCGVETLTQL